MSGYAQGPSVPTTTAPRAASTPVLPIISFVLSAVALFFLPIVFGVAAIVLAAIALARKERLAKIALVVAILATVIGMVLGALVVAGLQAG
jgi:SNF family Na+-dependent transporter